MVHGEKTHWLSGKERFLGAAVSKEGHTDSVLEHEKSYHYWFPWKRSNYKQYFLLQLRKQNPPYLLNNLCVWIYIYIHTYIHTYREQVKQKKNMFDGLLICQRILNSIFFWMQKCFIEIILVWEIIMIFNTTTTRVFFSKFHHL